MEQAWYYKKNDQQFGPLKTKGLLETINRESLVRKDGSEEWKTAKDFNELAPLLKRAPKPIFKDSSAEEHRKEIDFSIISGWILLTSIVAITVLELVENRQMTLYSVFIIAMLASEIRAFIGVKNYLSKLLDFKKANTHLNWLIAITIPSYLIWAIDSKYGLEGQFSTSTINILSGVFAVAMVLYFYHSVRLAIKLFEIEGPAVSSFKSFAVLTILYTGFSLGTFFLIENYSEILLLDTILSVIPIFFLISGFNKIKKSYTFQLASAT